MAPIEVLPVEVIHHIVDLYIDETINTELSTKAQVPLAQTNHHFYDIIRPLMRAIIVCQAAEEGRLDAIRKAHQDGVNLNMTGTTKRGQRGTPLHYAIINGHHDIPEFLVEVGVNPRIPSAGLCECWSVGTKSYALHTALAHSKVKGAAKLLIEGLGAYWSCPDMSALRDERPKDEDERDQILDLLINTPGPQPAGETLRYVLDYHMYNLEEGILARHDLDASVRDSLGCTPLFHAVSSGRLKTVKSLLQHPEADASVTGHYGLTPLHVAVELRSLPIFEVLLRRPEVDATKTDDLGRTPLHLAAFRSGVDIAELLLELPGVDAASPDGEGMTPLHWAVRGRDIVFQAWKRTEVEAGISSVESVESGTYVTESLEIMNILLARPEVNAGLHDKKGLTPLHRACLLGDRKVAELLLQREDVDPNARGLNGQTPLHIAASCRHPGALELMDLLLEQPGVEITDCDYDGRTILHYIGGGLPQAWRTRPVIENALREGVPIDRVSTNGLTAFHQAICSSNYLIAKFLLWSGADPMVSKRFKYNHSLLRLCTGAPNSPEDDRNEVVEELISRGIEIDTYTDSPLFDIDNDEDEKIDNVEGIRSTSLVVGTDCTPLLWTALGEQSTKAMEMLLDAGADPNAYVVIRDLELEGKTKSNGQAFLSGVFRLAWDPEGASDEDIIMIEERLELLLKHGSRLDFDGPVDSPLKEACEAAEDGRMRLLRTLLECSTAKNVSQRHVEEVICEYANKPQHEEILSMLRAFEQRLFSK
ncbi:hypothetical protein FSHL1_002407 [Fusarium sambucinum]